MITKLKIKITKKNIYYYYIILGFLLKFIYTNQNIFYKFNLWMKRALWDLLEYTVYGFPKLRLFESILIGVKVKVKK